MRRLRLIARVLTALILTAAGGGGVAQTNTARLEGMIQDQTGAAVPNARIVAVNTKTETTTEASSNIEGYFIVERHSNPERTTSRSRLRDSGSTRW